MEQAAAVSILTLAVTEFERAVPVGPAVTTAPD